MFYFFYFSIFFFNFLIFSFFAFWNFFNFFYLRHHVLRPLIFSCTQFCFRPNCVPRLRSTCPTPGGNGLLALFIQTNPLLLSLIAHHSFLLCTPGDLACVAIHSNQSISSQSHCAPCHPPLSSRCDISKLPPSQALIQLTLLVF